jgi:transcriptional regulator of acetoin/glycerol metabolism
MPPKDWAASHEISCRKTWPHILEEHLRMTTYLITDYAAPLFEAKDPTLNQIAKALAGAGLGCVTIMDLNRAAILNWLNACKGNRTHAARELGISARTLQRIFKGSRQDDRTERS